MRGLLAIALTASAVLFGQASQVERQSASEYPANTSAPHVEIGAEFLARSIPVQKGVLFARDYLAIDIGVFPKPGPPVGVGSGQFTLVINREKIPLQTHSPGMVAASMEYPDWEPHTGLTAGVDVEGVDVGTPQTWPGRRFPGDGRADPHPGHATAEVDSSESLDDQVLHVSLPSGEFSRPVRGLIYFQYKGKVRKIQSLRLLWDGPAGAHAELALR